LRKDGPLAIGKISRAQAAAEQKKEIDDKIVEKNDAL